MIEEQVVLMNASARAALRGLAALYDMRAVPGIAFSEMVSCRQEAIANSLTYRFVGIEGHPYDVSVEVVRDPGQEPDRAWHPHRAWVNSLDAASRMSWMKFPLGHWS